MSKAKTPKLRLEWIEAGSLKENPQNWRRHGAEQLSGLKQLIDDPEIGWAGAFLFNERTGRMIDGHARKQVVDPKTPVPVLIGNWSEESERKILLTLDPVASMATADDEHLRQLLEQVELQSGLQPLGDMLAEMAGSDEETKLKALAVKSPPKTTWVLIGIPTVQFGSINQLVEQIAAVPGTIVETSANDALFKELPTIP